MKTWTLRRGGEFFARPQGNTHCGVGNQKFKYECWITCSALDGQGFVVDNKIVAECVPGDNIFLSCEKAGEDIAAKVLHRIDAAIRPFVTEIKVKVGPDEINADATFTWTRDVRTPNEEPIGTPFFPVKKTVREHRSTAQVMLADLKRKRGVRKVKTGV